MIGLECPYCDITLNVYNNRWNNKTICPNCKENIFVDFDFCVMEDGDEWDIISLKKDDEFTEKYTFVKSEIRT